MREPDITRYSLLVRILILIAGVAVTVAFYGLVVAGVYALMEVIAK